MVNDKTTATLFVRSNSTDNIIFRSYPIRTHERSFVCEFPYVAYHSIPVSSDPIYFCLQVGLCLTFHFQDYI